MNAEERGRAGRAVADRIADLNTTRGAVAARAGVDPTTLRALIRGDRWPTLKTRNRIEDALHWAAGEISRRAQGADGATVGDLASLSTLELLQEIARRSGADLDPT